MGRKIKPPTRSRSRQKNWSIQVFKRENRENGPRRYQDREITEENPSSSANWRNLPAHVLAKIFQMVPGNNHKLCCVCKECFTRRKLLMHVSEGRSNGIIGSTFLNHFLHQFFKPIFYINF